MHDHDLKAFYCVCVCALSCQRQRRHQRVKTWTRHVDIFNKDFVFVPVNQEWVKFIRAVLSRGFFVSRYIWRVSVSRAHWYLVVICFPGLDEPKFEAWNGPSPEMGRNQSVTSELQAQEHAQGSTSPNDDAETPPTLNQSDGADTETGMFDYVPPISGYSYLILNVHVMHLIYS